MSKTNELNKLRNIAVAVGVSATLAVTGCGNSNNTSFNDSMFGRSDNTCFDELVGNELLNKVDNLEKYLDISERLHKMNISDNTAISDYQDVELMSTYDLYSLIFNYEDKNYTDVPKEEIGSILYVQNKLVNAYLRDEGYSIMADATLNCLKARVADAAGLDEVDAAKFVVMDQTSFEELVEFPFSKVCIGDYNIRLCSSLMDLNRAIYTIQSQETAAKKVNEKAVYNRDRNKLQAYAIKVVNKCLNSNYEVTRRGNIKRK